MGTLFVVATPIGNLEDITLRALRVLKEADLIAAEDTRHTKKLLSHYGISKDMTSYHEHNEKEKAAQLVEKLKAGADIALVTDAGTPGISDPGYRLIKLANENSIRVEAIPGPSALTALLSICGLPTDSFSFHGFLPSSAGARRTALLGFKGRADTIVLFESAKRLEAALTDIIEVLGDTEIVIGRELTKAHEEIIRGRTGKVLENVKGRELKGEVALVLRIEEAKAFGSPAEELEKLLRAGFRLKDAAKAVADSFNISGSEAYKEALRVKALLEGK